MNAEVAKQLAPTGKLRVAVLMLSYFVNDDAGTLTGWSPELGVELARRLGVPYELVHIENPADMIEAFRAQQGRRRVYRHHKGPRRGFRFRSRHHRSQNHVPGAGRFEDQQHPGGRPGGRAHSRTRAQRAGRAPGQDYHQGYPDSRGRRNAATGRRHAERGQRRRVQPRPRRCWRRRGPACPARVSCPAVITTSRSQSATPRASPPSVVEFCRKFAEDVKASGFLQKALDRMGDKAEGVVVFTQ